MYSFVYFQECLLASIHSLIRVTRLFASDAAISKWLRIRWSNKKLTLERNCILRGFSRTRLRRDSWTFRSDIHEIWASTSDRFHALGSNLSRWAWIAPEPTKNNKANENFLNLNRAEITPSILPSFHPSGTRTHRHKKDLDKGPNRKYRIRIARRTNVNCTVTQTKPAPNSLSSCFPTNYLDSFQIQPEITRENVVFHTYTGFIYLFCDSVESRRNGNLIFCSGGDVESSLPNYRHV